MSLKKPVERKYKADRTWNQRIVRYAIGIPIFLTIYLILMLLYIYPHWPADLIGWTILLFVGIPICLFLELIGESVLRKETGQAISTKKFSIKRLLVAISICIRIIVVLVLLWSTWGSSISIHFS